MRFLPKGSTDMMFKKTVLAAACVATLITVDVGSSTPASANDAAAGAAAGFVGGMILGGALAGGRPEVEEEVVVRRRRPVRVYEEEEYVRPRRCWTESWRDRWGDYHDRRVCR